MFKEFIKKYHLMFYLFILFLLIWIAFIDGSSFYHRYKVQKKYEKMQIALQELELENKKLEDENSRLKNDPKTWETLAREKYGMKGKDEKNYYFSEEDEEKDKK